MKDFINVGLLGAGTVGGGVIKVLEKNAADIEKKVGKPIRITKVLDRNVEKRRAEYGEQYFFTDKIEDILDDPDIDIVVELLGREHPAKEYIVAAFEKGLTLADGTVCLPAVLMPLGPGESLVTVVEGKYHQVRRMLASRGMRVTYLERRREGGLTLGALPRGTVRELTDEELGELEDGCQ